MNNFVDMFFEKMSKVKKTDYSCLNKLSLEEMATLDLHNKDVVPFPYNKFDIRIWHNDHNPPHFHIIDKENGWRLSFLIENGDVFNIKKFGKDYSMYNYIVKNFPIWLDEESKLDDTVTNREMALKIHEEFQDMLK